MYSLKTVYANHLTKNVSEDLIGSSLFLAGPTPRSEDVPSWRPEALKILSELEFKGNVIIPEPNRMGDCIPPNFWMDPKNQIIWEQRHLAKASVVMFWVPREMKTMPGLTTNIEFGMYFESGKITFGAPDDAEHTGYMRHCCEQESIPIFNNLKELCRFSVNLFPYLSGST